MNNKEKEILCSKLCDLANNIILAEPPFDNIHQLKGMCTEYKWYVKYYNEIDEQFRQKIIAAEKFFAKHMFRALLLNEKQFDETYYQHLKVSNDFGEWFRKRYSAPNESLGSDYEKIEINKILKNEIPKHFTNFKFKKIQDMPVDVSFVENNQERTQIVIDFEKGSYGMDLSIFIGLTNTNIFKRLGDFLGGGSFSIYFQTKKQFYEGLEEIYAVLDFFLPKLKQAIFEASQEWDKLR